MPWNLHGGDMSRAMDAIPKDTARDGGYSTPDVYGRAAQLYLSLQTAAQQSLFDGEEVLMWRGLLAMLALRNILDMPLYWERVVFKPGDLLGNALSNIPGEKRQLLYPDEKEYQWNGQSFYALTWAPDGVRQADLAIYSPLTLLYPVADWRETFSQIPELHKFFDNTKPRPAFRNCLYSLQSGERKLVYLWLRVMSRHLYGEDLDGTAYRFRRSYQGTDSEAKGIICQHLDRYIEELERHDGALRGASADGLEWKSFTESISFAGLPKPLISAYKIPGPPLFADQICYFKVAQNGPNPFGPCNHSVNYKVEEHLDEYDMYAFLPIHPERQNDCLASGLAQNMRMRLIPDPGGDINKQYIRASTRLDALGDFLLERDYLIERDLTDKRDVAIGYKEKGTDEDIITDRDTWPLIAVWPNVIGTGWKEYYVMRRERQSNHLELYHEAPWEMDPQAPVVRGSNDAVVKTTYVPDAIPFVREVQPGKRVSVGVVTPKIPPRQGGTTVATVAVDFGTTSTRVFYRLEANPDQINEIIPSQQDKPLAVTDYQGSTEKYEEMGKSFISPLEPGITGTSLLSIFRRSEAANKPDVPPILEGVIYHPEEDEDKYDLGLLVTDLKWNGDSAEPYYIAFMKQLCIHIMSILYREKGVNVIHWIYALPRAMEQERGGTKRVMGIWDNMGRFLNQTAGNIQSNIVHPLTESVAASRFFAVRHTGEINKKKGYLVVDIGGGTTDVALWWSQDGNKAATLRWHTSVKIAGRKMFTNWIARELPNIQSSLRDPRLLKLIDGILNPPENSGKDRTMVAEETKIALVDRMLSSYSAELYESYEQGWKSSTSQWAMQLSERITQAAVLLMFCLGYQIGALMGNRLYSVKSQQEEPGYFSVAIAGRGSLMWDWLLDCGDKTLCDFFRRGVWAAGVDQKRNSDPNQSAVNPGSQNPDQNPVPVHNQGPEQNQERGWPDVDIRIVRDSDPKSTVGKGLLVSTANLDKSDGWGKIENAEKLDRQMENSAYYSRAAEIFLDYYSQMFDGTRISRPDLNSLSGYAQHARTTVNDVFKVLMETIFSYLEARS